MNPNCFRLTSVIKCLWPKCHKFLVRMAKKVNALTNQENYILIFLIHSDPKGKVSPFFYNMALPNQCYAANRIKKQMLFFLHHFLNFTGHNT